MYNYDYIKFCLIGMFLNIVSLEYWKFAGFWKKYNKSLKILDEINQKVTQKYSNVEK